MSAINVVDIRRGIAKTVISARMAQGMTTAVLAAQCGVSVKTIREVEERGTLSVETLVALAHGLDMTLDDLVPVAMSNGEF